MQNVKIADDNLVCVALYEHSNVSHNSIYLWHKSKHRNEFKTFSVLHSTKSLIP